jgi:PBSX family phage terminase large subunit
MFPRKELKNMILTPAQSIILSDKHRFRVLLAGRRFGKTTLAVEEIKCLALSREARIAYIAPTYQQARDIAWQMLIKELKPPKPNESRLEFKIAKSIIQLRGWEAIETLRGQRFDFIVIDEVAMMRNFWINWEEVIRPTLTDTKGQVIFISTPKGFNHFYDLYNKEQEDQDYKSFHYTSYDNPHLPVEELDKAKEEIPEDRFAQEYMADFRKTEGLVYKEFSREKNVTIDFPETYTDTIIGIDFGYTNPAAIIPIGIDSDSNYWIKEEWYKAKQTTEQIAEQAILYKSTKCYPDPAEPDRIVILNKAGLNCREVSKDIVAGVDHVRELFKQGRIHIHPDCKNIIYELETYRYPDKKPDKNEEEKPVKDNDHALDALRYALYTNKPIIQINDPYFEQHGTWYRDD